LLQSFGRPLIILLPLDLITPDGFTTGAMALTRCDLTFAWTVLDLFSGLALGAINDECLRDLQTSSNKVEQKGGRTNVGSVSTQERWSFLSLSSSLLV
jgi:hypothetical protein